MLEVIKKVINLFKFNQMVSFLFKLCMILFVFLLSSYFLPIIELIHSLLRLLYLDDQFYYKLSNFFIPLIEILYVISGILGYIALFSYLVQLIYLESTPPKRLENIYISSRDFGLVMFLSVVIIIQFSLLLNINIVKILSPIIYHDFAYFFLMGQVAYLLYFLASIVFYLRDKRV